MPRPMRQMTRGRKIKKAIGRAIVVGGIITALASPPGKKAIHTAHEFGKQVIERAERKHPGQLPLHWRRVDAKLVPFEIKNFFLTYAEGKVKKRVDLGKHIVEFSRKYGLHPELGELIPNLLLRESELKPKAKASYTVKRKIKVKGKTITRPVEIVTGEGLGQLSPKTWKLVRANVQTVLTNVYHPVQNVEGVVWYLSYLDSLATKRVPNYLELQPHERQEIILASYKYGPENVFSGEVDSTDAYVNFIIHTPPDTALSAWHSGQHNLLFNQYRGVKTKLAIPNNKK